MKFSALLPLLALALIVSGCASTSQRINKNEALFNSYSPAEQRLIRMGEIAVGFDPEQVRMALGDPSRETTVTTAAGKQIVWEYREVRPSLGFSVGAGTSTRGSGVGVGTGVGVSPDRSRLQTRVVFDRHTGEVAEIQSFN